MSCISMNLGTMKTLRLVTMARGNSLVFYLWRGIGEGGQTKVGVDNLLGLGNDYFAGHFVYG